MQFTVQQTTRHNAAWKLVPAFKVVGYSGPGVNFPTESEPTFNRDEAETWCAAANRGEYAPDARFASYSDD